MINFGLPSLDIGMAECIGLVELWKQCSSCAGFCCALGINFLMKESMGWMVLSAQCCEKKHQKVQATGCYNLFFFGLLNRCVIANKVDV